MDLRQLKYFCAVVDQGSFHKAADALNISPPALSLSIKKLETELAVPLFERKPGGILPTSFGNCLYASARAIQANVESAVDQLNRIRGIGNGRVNVGLLPYGIPSAMGELIGRFCDRYPGLRVQTALGSYGYLVGRLNDGELDFMVSESGGPATQRGVVHEPLFRLRYGLVVGQKHPLAGRRNLALARVMDYRLAYSTTWRVVLENWDETFADAGLEPPPQPMGEATDDFLRAMLTHCNMVAVLPMIGTIKDAIEAGQLAELHVPRVEWFSTVSLVYRNDETLAPDARLLLEETRRQLAVPIN
jgi:DNA-binding transcriptional LysR family regulator